MIMPTIHCSRLMFAGEIVLYATYQSSPQSFGREPKETGSLADLAHHLTSQ